MLKQKGMKIHTFRVGVVGGDIFLRDRVSKCRWDIHFSRSDVRPIIHGARIAVLVCPGGQRIIYISHGRGLSAAGVGCLRDKESRANQRHNSDKYFSCY